MTDLLQAAKTAQTTPSVKTDLASHFAQFQAHIIGQDQEFQSPYGAKRIIYADWTASGRLYQPIEDKLLNDFAPFVANTHTETNVCGTSMTVAYHQARHIIKQHVNAGKTDCLISYGSGMTGVINKFQRILGLKIPEKRRQNIRIPDRERPVVFVTHMEHHSNQTSWLETICDLEVIAPTADGLIDLIDFQRLIDKYADRPMKIAAITACSNVTGIETPYHQMAAMMHAANGLCFVDFACSAPYVKIDMHPADQPHGYLDAIYFSPHKFLGGPSSSGILIFNSRLYDNRVPDNPGGGTVKWTNPWKEHEFIDDIEEREDGGTPPFLQTIRTALCVKLKEKMGIENIRAREDEQLALIFNKLENTEGVHILAKQHRHRLGVVSFYVENLHFNLAVKLLNDRFGIQVRGGCSCAGTYGHYLLEVDKGVSDILTNQISTGDLTNKPGWIRMSIHPTMPNAEVEMVCDAIIELAKNHKTWSKAYVYDPKTNEFKHQFFEDKTQEAVNGWFDL
jgi:selenocysteine lyase/cysteine desulfurase